MLPLAHHLISPSQLSVTPIPQIGQRVQIITGSLQDETGVIASVASDDLYFIWRDCDRSTLPEADPSEKECPRVPDGPFLRDEFKVL